MSLSITLIAPDTPCTTQDQAHADASQIGTLMPFAMVLVETLQPERPPSERATTGRSETGTPADGMTRVRDGVVLEEHDAAFGPLVAAQPDAVGTLSGKTNPQVCVLDQGHGSLQTVDPTTVWRANTPQPEATVGFAETGAGTGQKIAAGATADRLSEASAVVEGARPALPRNPSPEASAMDAGRSQTADAGNLPAARAPIADRELVDGAGPQAPVAAALDAQDLLENATVRAEPAAESTPSERELAAARRQPSPDAPAAVVDTPAPRDRNRMGEETPVTVLDQPTGSHKPEGAPQHTSQDGGPQRDSQGPGQDAVPGEQAFQGSPETAATFTMTPQEIARAQLPADHVLADSSETLFQPHGSQGAADPAAKTESSPLFSARLSTAWLTAMQNESHRIGAHPNGWHVLEMKLSEREGAVIIKTRRVADKVAVSVGFSDANLQGLASAHAERLQEALRAQYSVEVDLSLLTEQEHHHDRQHSNGNAPQVGKAGRKDAPTNLIPDDANAPHRSGAGREWIG